jgi:hypothetical protein
MIKKLDLHGVKHDDVERVVENFVLLNEPPLEIICGNSDKMQDIVRFKLYDLQDKKTIDVIVDRWDWGVFRIR